MRQSSHSSHIKRARRMRGTISRHEGRHGWRWWRSVRTGAVGLFLAAAILTLTLVLVQQSTAYSGHGGTGAIGAGPQWVSLAATTPTGILQAARATGDFQAVLSAPQTRLGALLHTGTLGTPILVRAYRPTTATPDVWVIPVYDASAPGAHIAALLDFAYDAAHQRIRPLTFAGPFVPSDPEYGQPFPRFTATQATAIFTTQRGHALAGGAVPELIYFPANLDAIAGPQPTLHWSGGGQFPDLAVWRMPAANGSDYIVGSDGRIYAATQLPLA